jgi:O-antigen ligase
MRISILSDGASRVIHGVALGAVVAAPLVLVPVVADPYQPGRALVIAAAGLAAATAGAASLPRTATSRIALAALATAAALVVASALLSHPASAVFGVHGRFQGLVSGAAALVSFSIGIGAARRARVVPRVAAAVLMVESVVVAWQLATGRPPTGTMGNQVLAGGWMAIAVALVAAGARAERGRVAAILWSAAATGVLTLGVIGSRGAWVGLIAAGVVLGISARPRVRRFLLAGTLGIVVAGAALGGGGSLGKLDPAALSTGSAAARAAIWTGTAGLIADRPLTGVGPGRFLYGFAQYQPAEHARSEPGVRPDQAHSLVLQTAAESGIPAAFAALVFAGAAFIAVARRLRTADGIALVACAGLAAWGGQALFGISTIESDGLAFMLAGIALARTDAPVVPAGAGARLSVSARVLTAALSLTLALSCVWYLRADAAYERGVRAFFDGEMAHAWKLETTAIALNPLVDTYRVAASDAALYNGGPRSTALALVERGLILEPASYDLALARARLLGSADGEPDVVIGAYLSAIERYPLGIEVNYEAMDVAVRYGRGDVARGLAVAMLRTYPDDPVARAVAEEAGDGY